ncbi:citrate lyase subunit beta/citryl-CoA lyase [Nakamurella sp. UYEF19]|uniref:HpcH/HpaI aldolase/citrate lyase family protein n=1 Tax=Nakamurella sp. UYEF19 TaxID=1756392 RepID=UPI003399701C
MRPPGVLCSLYVPGDRPDRFAKALATAADLVVIDLEDSVTAKAAAREHVRRFLMSGVELDRISIRINSGPEAPADLVLLREIAAAGLAPSEIRVPKVNTPADLDELAQLQAIRVHALIESAAGVQALPGIAAHPAVVAVGLGEADLAGELALGDEDAFTYCRSRLVVAAAAAGLRPPAMSVHADIRDLSGLAESCRRGRLLGLFGRSAVHPSQIPVIRMAFAPSDSEITSARQTLDALDRAALAGQGVATTADGTMVDAAMRAGAERILAFAPE